MSQFHLLRPEWLLALIPLTLLLLLRHRRKSGTGSWRAACDPALLPYLLIERRSASRLPATLLLASGGLLAILALAGPTWTQLEQPLFRQHSSLVILLDLSRSMDSTDVRPSRLSRARFELLDILQRRREGDTALIVYAAQPFVVTPLTDDTATIAALVGSLTTDIPPSQGSRPDLALQQGGGLLEQAGAARGDLLFITDGISAELLERTLQARPPQYRVSVLAVGTREGGPIPLPAGGFLKNDQGEIVIAGLDGELLRSLAARGGGSYSELTADDRDIDRLLSGFSRDPLPDLTQQSDRLSSDQWREEGPWLLLPLLPLAALAFRHGYLVFALSLALVLPEPAHALDWSALWQRPDQRAAATLEAGDPAQAAREFQDRAWSAAAHYRAQAYQESLDALAGIETPQADYNRGNALARLGRLEEAIKAYDKALTAMPQDEDARYNRELVANLLDEQQQPPSGGQQQPDGQQRGERDNPRQPGQAEQAGGAPDSGTQQPEPTGEEAASSAPEQSDHPPGDEASQPAPARQDDGAQQPEQQMGGQQQSPGSPEASPAETTRGSGEQDGSDGPVGSDQPPDPQAQATQQWLRSIPDDPGGLLKRKFRYQYQQQYQGRSESQPW